MNRLTVRKLPIFTERSGCDHKIRMDRALADMVAASVQIKYPTVRVGKRYSIEYALLEWLHSQGLVKDGPVIPVAGSKDNGNHE
jgi:hypothetical protein